MADGRTYDRFPDYPWVATRAEWIRSATPVSATDSAAEPNTDCKTRVHDYPGMTPHSAARQVQRIHNSRIMVEEHVAASRTTDATAIASAAPVKPPPTAPSTAPNPPSGAQPVDHDTTPQPTPRPSAPPTPQPEQARQRSTFDKPLEKAGTAQPSTTYPTPATTPAPPPSVPDSHPVEPSPTAPGQATPGSNDQRQSDGLPLTMDPATVASNPLFQQIYNPDGTRRTPPPPAAEQNRGGSNLPSVPAIEHTVFGQIILGAPIENQQTPAADPSAAGAPLIRGLLGVEPLGQTLEPTPPEVGTVPWLISEIGNRPAQVVSTPSVADIPAAGPVDVPRDVNGIPTAGVPESILAPRTIFLTDGTYTEAQLLADAETVRNGPIPWVGGLSPYDLAMARLERARYSSIEQRNDLQWATRGTRTVEEALRQQEAMERLRRAGIPWLDDSVRAYVDAEADVPVLLDPTRPAKYAPPAPTELVDVVPTVHRPFDIDQFHNEAAAFAHNAVDEMFIDPAVVLWEYKQGRGDHSALDAAKAAGELALNIPGPDNLIYAGGIWAFRGLRGLRLAPEVRALIEGATSSDESARVARQLREEHLLDEVDEFAPRPPAQTGGPAPNTPPRNPAHADSTPTRVENPSTTPHTQGAPHTPGSTTEFDTTIRATTDTSTEVSAPTRSSPSTPDAPAPGGWVPPQRPVPTNSVDVTDLNPRRRKPFTSRELAPDTVYNLPNNMRIFTDAEGKPFYVEARAGNKIDGFTAELRHPAPNTTYRIDDRFTYKTDANGRVVEAHADSLVYRPTAKNEESIYRNANDQAKVGNLPMPNKEDYHGGHLIADIFGGPGDKLNLIPMDKVLNGASGGWGQLEAEFRSILKSDPNARIEYNVKLDYSGGGPQPGKIAIEYRINDGEVLLRSFENA